MSLQRVFESARKLGVPVIITDPAGRDPMVVVPLEQFEAMAGDGAALAPQSSHAPIENRRMERFDERIQVPISTPDVPPMVREMPATSAEESSEISTDERFYLEPVDDQG